MITYVLLIMSPPQMGQIVLLKTILFLTSQLQKLPSTCYTYSQLQ